MESSNVPIEDFFSVASTAACAQTAAARSGFVEH